LIGDEVAVFAFSTSGETLEVVDLLVAATARLRCTATVLLTCRANSSAGRIASTVLDLGELEEADALKLAPTCSTTALLAVSDALACAYAVEAGLTREQFGRLHHAGYLGSVALGDG
jgi:arabinose-5-phosphate isomerase